MAAEAGVCVVGGRVECGMRANMHGCSSRCVCMCVLKRRSCGKRAPLYAAAGTHTCTCTCVHVLFFEGRGKLGVVLG